MGCRWGVVGAAFLQVSENTIFGSPLQKGVDMGVGDKSEDVRSQQKGQELVDVIVEVVEIKSKSKEKLGANVTVGRPTLGRHHN